MIIVSVYVNWKTHRKRSGIEMNETLNLHRQRSEIAQNNSRTDRKIMQHANGNFLEILNTLIGQTTKHLDKIERRKYETLITVHMHQRVILI